MTQQQRSMRALTVAGVAVILALMWAGAVGRAYSDRSRGETIVQWLQTPVGDRAVDDPTLYLHIRQLMQADQGYYRAVRVALAEDGPVSEDPLGAVRVRLPTLYWLWSLPLPAPAVFVGGLLLLASLAVVGAHVLGRLTAGPRLAFVGTVAVAAYFGAMASSFRVTYGEPWAAALLLIAAACWALMTRHAEDDSPAADWGWLLASALAALLAALSREIAVFGLVAGVAAALASPPSTRLRRLSVWLVALALFAVAYHAHIGAAGGALFDAQKGPGLWASPGLERFVAAATEGDEFLPLWGMLSLAAVAFSVLGAVALRERSLRIFAIVSAVVPLAAMAVLGPVDLQGNVYGYWGILIKPLLWALVPAGLAFAASALRPRERHTAPTAEE